ncbi:MAG: ABC transporter permease [Nitrospinota bacterium]
MRTYSAVLLLTAWEIYGRGYINPVIFTYPSAVVGAFVELVQSGKLLEASRQSVVVLTTGWVSAVAAGILLGLFMARFRVVENALDLYVNALYATPIVALVPLIINWFGFTQLARVVIVFLFAVFPVLINTIQGVKNVDEALLEVARSFCSTERQTWRDVVVPSSVPYIVAGLRLAIGRGLVGLVVAELFTSLGGLGGIIEEAANTLETDKMFVPIALLMVLGVVLTESLKQLERRFAAWKVRE